MIRRTIAAAGAAGVLALTPAIAFADTYPPVSEALMCEDLELAPDESATCFVYGPEGGLAEVTFSHPTGTPTAEYVAGSVTVSGAITGTDAEFEVTAPNELGTISVTATVDGQATNAVAIAVVAEDASLPRTGFENAGLAIGAGALLVGGAAAVAIAARRRRDA